MDFNLSPVQLEWQSKAHDLGKPLAVDASASDVIRATAAAGLIEGPSDEVSGGGTLARLAAAVAVGAGEPAATRLAAQAKRLATDTGFEVVNGCLQLHGGYGYLRDHPIERVLRDVRVHQILEGTNEIMRVVIARKVLGGNRG